MEVGFFCLFVTSLAKEVIFWGALVCLSVCLSVDNITQKCYERIGLKFYGGVLGSTVKNNEELIQFWW